METIGILGTGRMALRLAAQLVDNGHKVLIGSRDASRARLVADRLGPHAVQAATYPQAMAAPLVLPAIFVRDGLFELLRRHAHQLEGKVVIDILNPFNEDYSDFILPWDTSAGEELAKVLPRSTVVGIFKNVFWEAFDEPRFAEGYSDVYVVGDDEAAKSRVTGLFLRSPFRFVDAGRAVNSRVVERMTLLASELGAREGYSPRVGWRFLGEPWTPGAKDPFAELARA